jgi:hypothetical protein
LNYLGSLMRSPDDIKLLSPLTRLTDANKDVPGVQLGTAPIFLSIVRARWKEVIIGSLFKQ